MSKSTAGKNIENPYHKMIEEVQDYAILMLDKDGNILNWNLGAEKIKGYQEAEIIGKNFRIFYKDEDRANKLPERLIAEATTHGRAMHEGWRVRKNKERFWGSIVITALHNENNEVIGFTKVTRDLTERKLAEEQLKQNTKELEFRNRELEQFVYIASHDLQEPLRKIQVFSGLIEKNLDDKESAARFLERINAAAKRMSILIKDVLQYSKLSKGEGLEVPVDLNTVLKGALEDFDLLIEQRKAVVNFVPLPVIMGIPIQLHQLFTNLLSNAIKFSKENPSIEISTASVSGQEIENAGLSPDKSYVKIIFKDQGIGFDPKYKEDIFKFFKRLQDIEPGTGIGLALCKKIVENHDGHISVISQPNQGTTFHIILPTLFN
jgi:PAS domain S-box-containing protein